MKKQMMWRLAFGGMLSSFLVTGSCFSGGVTEGFDKCFANLAVKTRPDGGREALVAGLDVFSDLPESRVLKAAVLDWLAQGK